MKLPDVTSLSRPNIRGPGGPTPSYSPAGFSAGTEAIAQGLGKMAAAANVFLEDMNKLEEFEVQRKFYETMSAADQQYQHSEQNADPTGKDFARSAMEQVGKHFDGSFLPSVPARLRPKYEAHIERQRFIFGRRALDFEFSQRNTHYTTEVKKRYESLAPGVATDPDSYDTAIADVGSFVEMSGLPPVAKRKLLDAAEEGLAKARIDGLNRLGRTQEAEDFSRAFDERLRQRQDAAPQFEGPSLAPPRPGTSPGYVAPRADVESYIVQAARARGIDPKVALTVYRHEGSSRWQSTVVKDGRRERSYGPFQLYIDGGLGNKFQRETGLDPRDPSTWKENIDFALDEAKKGGWGPWMGAKAAGITDRMGLNGTPVRTAQAPSPTATDVSTSDAPRPPGDSDIDTLNTDLPVGPMQAYARQSQAKLDKENAQLARAASAEIADYSAFLRAGNERDGPRETALHQKYGQVVGDAIIERLDKDAAFGQKVRAVETASPEELQGIVADYQQRLKSVDGFAENSKEFADILKVVERRNKALADDPATFVMRSDDVRQSYQAFQTAMQQAPEMAPGLARDYASATLAEQERLGVPPDLRRILPASMVDHIGKQFTVREGGQNAAGLMRNLESQWGNHWPKVYGELAKSLPGGALVIGAMNRPEQARAAEQLAEAAAVGKKQLEQMHKDETLKGKDGLQAKVLDELKEFRSTLVNNPGAEVTFNTFQEATYLLALSYLGQGDPIDRAAERAADDVLGKKYEFAGTFRIPREYNGAQVRAGAYGALYDVLPQTEIDLPPSLSGLKQADVKAAYISALQSNGFWVTAPDESGLVLYEGTQRRAVTVGGKPFLVPWEKLQKIGGGVYDPSFEATPGFDPLMDAPPGRQGSLQGNQQFAYAIEGGPPEDVRPPNQSDRMKFFIEQKRNQERVPSPGHSVPEPDEGFGDLRLPT